MDIEVVIEIPKGSRNKYEMNHHTGDIWLDRHLFTAMSYPADYGFVPGTLAEDGDPLDVLLLLDEPTFPGCHVMARPVGVFFMHDDKGEDAKVLCVPAGDHRWDDIQDVHDIRPHLRNEIRHFFEAYKELEPAKFSEVRGWDSREAAWAAIEDARRRHADPSCP
ncbi:MAG: inorganic pyrophosphatase [Acidimicrobiia bacterium]|nr:inorganic pyrophosphatase [Acidimicrobiia bacterium]